jgi:DNA-binding CsgD family transcriptional regulator
MVQDRPYRYLGWLVAESRSALHELALVLQASPESDALIILGRLLDSLPIGFHVTDCGNSFRILYGNQVWERWLGAAKLPVVGKPLADVFPTAAQSGVLDIMGQVCRTGQPRHLKSFEFRELGILERGKAGETSRWDWEIYPLSGPGGEVTHLLNVVMDVSEPSPKKGRTSAAERKAANLQREEASGVLRIFGVAPGPASRKPMESLSPRERQVADLLALGLTNTGAAQALNLSSTTISSHVGHILAKLGFRSRAQVAAWVIESRLGQPVAELDESDELDNP